MQSSCCSWCEWTSKHTAACDCHYHYIRDASDFKWGWKFQKMGLFWDLQCVWTVLEDSLLPSLLCVLGDFHVNVLFHLWIYRAQQNSGFSAAGGGPELSWLQPILVVRNHIKKSFGQCHRVEYTHAHTQRKPNSGTHTSLQYRRLANLDLKTFMLN